MSLGLAAGLLLAPDAAAQDGRELGALVRQHMAVVRDRRLTLEEKRPAMDALLELGTEGPRQLAARLASDCKKLRKENARDAARLLDDFADACEELVEERLDRAALREVDELRDLLRGHARDAQLTKETIVAECDPALARLEELLTVAPEEVPARDAEWAAAEALLLASLADEQLLADYSARCVERLEAHPEGARIARRVERPEDPSGEPARLEAERERLAFFATPMPEADRRTMRENAEVPAAPEPEGIGPEERAGVRYMNRIRVLLDLGALRIDRKLCVAGRDHSKDMRELGFFSHESPVEGKRTFDQRAALAGTSARAENLTMGEQTGRGAILAWWHSPGHHRNMLGAHARVGLGRSGVYWTQLFG